MQPGTAQVYGGSGPGLQLAVGPVVGVRRAERIPAAIGQRFAAPGRGSATAQLSGYGWGAGEGSRTSGPSPGAATPGHLTNHLIPHLGHRRLDALRVEHVAEMLAEVQGGDATRQRVRATLRAALSDAMRQGLVTVNVASLVKAARGKAP